MFVPSDRKWYNGDFILPEIERGDILIIPGGYIKRHWTAEAAHILVAFWLKHWKFLIITMLSVIGLILTIISL